MRRGITTLGCALTMLLVTAPAQGQAPGAAQPRTGGTAVIAGPNELQAMNSLVANETWTLQFINHALFLPLVRYDRHLRLEPRLAQSWRMVGDTAVVFTLRRDVRWHDGRPTTAHDVAFTFQRMKDEKTAFPGADAFSDWLAARVLDDHTIKFSIKPHRDPLDAWASTAIMPRHLLEAVPADKLGEAPFNQAPVGNGPFKFVSHRTNDRWVFEANRSFARSLGGRPYLDRVVYRVIPENSAQMAEAITGGADLLFGVRAEQVRELDARPHLRALLRPSTRYLMITWNGKRAPLDNAAVRKALSQALNRAQMVQVLRAGYAQLATGPISPAHWAYDTSLKPLAHDSAAASQALARAGFRDRNGDGTIEDAQGKPFVIELKIPANNAFNRDLAEMVRADLAKVGVTVNVRPVDFPTLIEDVSSPQRNFDAAVLALDSELKVNLREVFHSAALDGPFQSASYANAEVDRILDAAPQAKDRAQATRLYHRLQRILLDEQPLTFLWYPPDLVVANERLKGVDMDVRGQLVNLQRWWTTGR